MKELIITIGASGCGKSTWCNKFLQTHPDFIYLNPDTMRRALTGDESCQDKNYLVFANLEAMAKYFMLLERPILVDATCYNKKNRNLWLELAKDYNYYTSAIVFKTSLEQCLLNNSKRARKVPDEVIKRQFENLTLPLTEVNEVKYIDWKE